MIIEELRKDRGKFGDNRETNKGDIELDMSFLLHKLLSVSFIVVLEFEMGILLLLHNLIMTDLENRGWGGGLVVEEISAEQKQKGLAARNRTGGRKPIGIICGECRDLCPQYGSDHIL